MKRQILVMIIVFILWLVTFALVKRTTADDTQHYVNRDWTPQEKLAFFTEEYGSDFNEINKVIKCESGWRVDVYGDKHKAFSYAQFHQDTFERWAKETQQTLYYDNPTDHLALIAYAFSKGDKYKDDWTCWTKKYML